MSQGGTADGATNKDVAGVHADDRGAVVGERTEGGRTNHEPGPLLLLPLSPFPAQLLAAGAAAVAGAARRALRGAAALHGLPAVPRAALAPRPERAEELLPRLPLLAGCVLSGRRGTNHRVYRGHREGRRGLLSSLCSL